MATRLSLRFVALLFTAAGGVRATAATYIWTGATGGGNWSTISPTGQMNWDLSAASLLLPAVPASASSTVLEFNSATGAVTTQDIATPFLLNQLEFGGGAGAFFIYGNPLEFAGANTTLADSATTAETINADIVLAGTNGQDLLVSGATSGESLILGGVISDVGTTGTQSGVDITALLNVSMTAANTYTGQTTIHDATLNIQNTDALQNSTANVINGGDLNLQMAGVNLGGLSGDNSATVVFSAPAGTAIGLLNFGFDNQNTTYSGTFVNNIANPAGAQIGFVKYGTGTFTYNGNAALPDSPNFVYVQTGTVALSSGGMDITSAGNLQGGPQKVAISVATGTTLLINQAFSLSSAGYAVVNGTGTITLDGTGTLWNARTVPQSAAGGIELSTFASGSTLNVQNSAILNTQALSINHAGTVNVTNGGQLTIADSGSFSQGDGIFKISTGSAVTVDQGTLTSQYITAGLSSTMALSDPAGSAALTIDGAYNATNPIQSQSTLDGVISDGPDGPGSIDITNNALVTMAGANTYTGTTTINGSTLVVQNTNALQDSTTTIINSGNLTIETPVVNGNSTTNIGGLSGDSTATVTFSPPTGATTAYLNFGANGQNTTYSGSFIDTAATAGLETAIQKYGTGTFTYNGTAGGTLSPNSLNVQAGEMVLSSGSMINSASGYLYASSSRKDIALYVNAGTTLLIDKGFQLSSAGYEGINGNATVTVDGAGTVWTADTFTNSNYGGLFISDSQAGSTLNVQNDATLNSQYVELVGQGALNITSGAAVNVSDSGPYATGNGFTEINALGALTIDSATLTTQYINSVSNATIGISDPIGGNALNINGAVQSAHATSTQSTLAGSISDAAGGPGSIDITNNALVTMAGANTYTGTTTINGSTLVVQNTNALQDSTTTIINSGNLTIETPVVNGNSTTNIGGLSGDSTATVTFSPPTGTTLAIVNIGGDNQSTTYSGTFSNTLTSAEAGFYKYGTGTFTYNGTATAAQSPDFLAAEAGQIHLTGAGSLNLISTGFTGFTGYSTLFADNSGSILIDNGFHVSATGYVTVHGTGVLTVSGSGTVINDYLTPNTIVGGILIGYAGKTSTMDIQDFADVSTPYLQVGDAGFAQNPGYGVLNLSPAGFLNVGQSGVFSNYNGQIYVDNGSSINVYASQIKTGSLTTIAGSTISLTDYPGVSGLQIDGTYSPANASNTESTLSGIIEDGAKGPGSIAISNGALVTMTSANTYTGDTNLSASTLIIETTNALQDSTANIINSGNLTIESPIVNGGSYTNVGGLSGDSTATVTFSPPMGATLARANIGADNQRTIYSGTFVNAGGAGLETQIIKYGTNTWVYNGTGGENGGLNSLYVQQGTAVLSSGSMTLTTSGPILSNSPYAISVAAGTSLLVNDGFTLNTVGYVGISGTGSITLDGKGTTWNATTVPSGILAGEGGILMSYASPFGGTVNVQNAATLNAQYIEIGDQGVLNITSGSSVTINYTGSAPLGNGLLDSPTNGAVNVNAATLTAEFVQFTDIGNLTLSDPVGGTALTINGTYDPKNATLTESIFHGTIADGASGPGSIAIKNNALVLLGGILNYTGTTSISGNSTVDVTAATANSSAYMLSGSSSLTFSGTTVNLGTTGLISVAQGSTAVFTTPITVNKGTLSGGGSLSVSAGGTTFNQSTIAAGTILSDNATGVVTFQSLIANGSIDVNSGTADFTSGDIAATASLTDGAVVNASGLEIDGQVSVATGGTFSNSGSDLLVTSAASFVVNPSAAATIASGTQMQLTGSLVNNGAITGAVTAGNGARVSGNGSFDALTLNSGATFSPGNSPGSAVITTAIWNPGSTYLWQINALSQGGGGTGANPGWDYVKIGNLMLPSSGGTVTIMIDSQTVGAIPADGPLPGFNANQKYSWLIATAGNNAFSSLSAFSLDSSAFVAANNLNAADSIAFSLSSSDGMNLYVNYSPVQTPEPTAISLFAGGAALLLIRKRRGKSHGCQIPDMAA